MIIRLADKGLSYSTDDLEQLFSTLLHEQAEMGADGVMVVNAEYNALNQRTIALAPLTRQMIMGRVKATLFEEAHNAPQTE